MAVKTITIDLEAYELLARDKRDGQSFSQVIKARFGVQPTAGRFLARARAVRIDASALDAMERHVQARSKSPARIVKP